MTWTTDAVSSIGYQCTPQNGPPIKLLPVNSWIQCTDLVKISSVYVIYISIYYYCSRSSGYLTQLLLCVMQALFSWIKHLRKMSSCSCSYLIYTQKISQSGTSLVTSLTSAYHSGAFRPKRWTSWAATTSRFLDVLENIAYASVPGGFGIRDKVPHNQPAPVPTSTFLSLVM
jgi:hypothetical protein